jgi:hypothetical protein
VPILFGLQGQIHIRGNIDASSSSEGGTAVGELGLGWAGVVGVRDASGAPVLGFEMTSGSGYEYGTAVVPEPASAWDLLCGALSLALCRRRRIGRS